MWVVIFQFLCNYSQRPYKHFTMTSTITELLQILRVISDINLKEVQVTDGGITKTKKVLECFLVSCTGDVVKMVCWMNAENMYKWLM